MNKGVYAGVMVFLLLILIAGAVFIVSQQNASNSPEEGSAEVGFARDMIVHHNQAVEMSLILYDRSENEALKSIARDIVLTQQNQIGQMQAWLVVWDVPFAGTDLPMTWMDMPTEGLMPGMATDEQMTALRDSTGTEADKLFIEMMIAHHQAGIHMAEGILDRTDLEPIRTLAQAMINGQQKEINELTLLGEQVGSEIPTESTPAHDH